MEACCIQKWSDIEISLWTAGANPTGPDARDPCEVRSMGTTEVEVMLQLLWAVTPPCLTPLSRRRSSVSKIT